MAFQSINLAGGQGQPGADTHFQANTKTNANFVEAEARLSALDAELLGIDARFDSAEADLSTIDAKLASMPASVGDYATAAELETGSARTVPEYAAERHFLGPDGTHQFRVAWSQNASDFWQAVGGIAGAGATLVALSGEANADGNLIAKGTGGHFFGNGAGVLAAVLDNGSGNRPANAPALKPGDPGKPVVFTAWSWGGETNVGIALQPLGNGAVMAQAPDNTTAGGNTRGQNAVDWQTARGSSLAVASSSFSTISGGNGNVANNAGAVVAGGQFNNAGGSNSWVPGGQRASTGTVAGKGAFASGRFAVDGDAQGGFGMFRRQSTSATGVQLTNDGAVPAATNVYALPNNSSFFIEGTAIARQVGGTAGTAGDSVAWKWECFAKRQAGAGTLVVDAVTVTKKRNDTNAAAWTFTVAADTTNGGLLLTGTAEANKTINWIARVDSVEGIG